MCFHNKGHKESTKDTKEIWDWLIGGVWGAALDPGGAAGPHTFVLPAPPHVFDVPEGDRSPHRRFRRFRRFRSARQATGKADAL